VPGTVLGAGRGSVLTGSSLALMLACGMGFRQRQGHPPTHKTDNESSGSKSNSLQKQVMLRSGVGNSPMTVAVVVAMTMVMIVVVTMTVIMTVGTAIGVNMLLSLLFIVTVITL